MQENDSTTNSAVQVAARGSRDALDNNTNRVSAFAGNIRYKLREKLRSVTKVSRLRGCGRALLYNHRFVRLVRDAQGKAHYRAIETCRRVWLCPVCGPRISAERARALQTQLEEWLAGGGAVWFLTLTFPHDFADALKVTAALAAKAFTRTLSGRAGQDIRARYGIAGFVRVLEVTLGRSGWHPHLHILVFLTRPRGVRARRAFHAAVLERFSRAIVQRGFRSPDPRNCPIEVVTTAQIGTYLAKSYGVAHEVTGGHLKRGRAGSRSPIQLQWDAVTAQSATDLDRLEEYESDMKGRRQLTYTKGLRALLGVAPPIDRFAAKCAAQNTDHEDAIELLTPESAAIDPDLWQRISARDGLGRQLQETYGSLGYEAALSCLCDAFVDTFTREALRARFRPLPTLADVGGAPCDRAS